MNLFFTSSLLVITMASSAFSNAPDLSSTKPMDIMKHHNDVVKIDGMCFKVNYDMCVSPSKPPACEGNDQEEMASSIHLDLLKFKNASLQNDESIVYEALGMNKVLTKKAYSNSFAWEDGEKKPIHLFLTLKPSQCGSHSPKIGR